MNLVKEYKENSAFKSEKDILESLARIFTFGSIESEYKNARVIRDKEEVNDLIISFLENLLSNDLLSTKKEKLSTINLLDEFNYRKEILHLIRNKNLLSNDIEDSSSRIGKKFMSSF